MVLLVATACASPGALDRAASARGVGSSRAPGGDPEPTQVAGGKSLVDPQVNARSTPKPFEQSIPRSTVALRFVPVPAHEGDPSGSSGTFWISATEVPWEAYDLLVYGLTEGGEGEHLFDAESRPSKPYINMDRGYGHEGYPVVSVSLHGAQTFCEWLSSLTGKRFRLPTEAEWERACRAESPSRWSFGDDAAQLPDHAWFKGNAQGKTHPVGEKEPNVLGVYDAHGNAAEWSVRADGSGVVCGGSFRDEAEGTGSAARVEPSKSWNRSDPQIPKSPWWLADAGFIGFRIVCEGTP